MNEYTRREEVRWTIAASSILVVTVAVAVVLLVTIKGQLVPDKAAIAQAAQTEKRVTEIQTCAKQAEALVTEVGVFNGAVKTAKLANEPDAGTKKQKQSKDKEKKKEDDIQLAWGTAAEPYRLAKLLALCKQPTETAIGARPEAAPGWDAVLKAGAVAAPADDNKAAQAEASRKLHEILGEAPLDKVAAHTKDAERSLKEQAAKEKAIAETAQVREPLPTGLLSRSAAVGVGVGLSVLTLLLSYISVAIASSRRASSLIPLRDAAKAGKPGAQAAAILRIAANHNGGEPGMVIGAGIGGLLTALIVPMDADLFAGGVMGGLLVGLGVQWAFRIALNASRWRGRATELAELEKPATPIVLVLSSVNQGLEAEFLQFFKGLSPEDAANTVEKLAAQAEERILAAADANRA